MSLKIKNTDLISNFTNMNEYVQKYEHINFDLEKMREAVDQLMLGINGRPPVKRVVFHPHLLFHGHVENQVEKYLENMRSQFPTVEWVKVSRLGAAQEVAEALVDRGLRCLCSTN